MKSGGLLRGPLLVDYSKMKRQKKKLKISTAIASKMLSISVPNFSPDPIEISELWQRREPRKMMKISHLCLVR